jgi:hypothetical protein
MLSCQNTIVAILIADLQQEVKHALSLMGSFAQGLFP